MVFKIKRGKHKSSKFNFGITFKNRLQFTGLFYRSCLYQLDGEDRYDINKFFGLSDNFSHMKDSLRLGWNCVNGKDIDLHIFAHVNGEYVYEKICTVDPNQEFGVYLYIGKEEYMIDIKYKGEYYRKFVKRESKYNFIRYLLFPYFGGNQPSPKNMRMNIKFIIRPKLFLHIR